MRASLLSLAWLLALASRAAEAPFPEVRSPAQGAKTHGLLLLGSGETHDWGQTVDAIRAGLKGKTPVEYAAGLADQRAIQKAVDALENRGVKMIVAVPLMLSSISEVLDQDRYLFGIRENPSKEFKGETISYPSTGRIKSRVPIVMTRALDDAPFLVEILAGRAKALSRDPARESLVLVGRGPAGKEAGEDWANAMSAVAERVRQKAGFRGVRLAALKAVRDQKGREKSEKDLRNTVKELHKDGQVVVVLLELDAGELKARVPRVLSGAFVRFDGKAVLPDSRIAKWVAESAESGAKLPDMRVFKDSGKPSARKTLEAPPPINTKGGLK